MNSLQFIVLSSVLLLKINSATCAKSDSHNVEWGAHGSRDVLLSRQILIKKAKLLQVVSQDFEFRQKADGSNTPIPRTITRIVVMDQYKNGNGGYATLKNGGPGLDYAQIHLKSQRGHGYNFVIDFFGM